MASGSGPAKEVIELLFKLKCLVFSSLHCFNAPNASSWLKIIYADSIPSRVHRMSVSCLLFFTFNSGRDVIVNVKVIFGFPWELADVY